MAAVCAFQINRSSNSKAEKLHIMHALCRTHAQHDVPYTKIEIVDLCCC